MGEPKQSSGLRRGILAGVLSFVGLVLGWIQGQSKCGTPYDDLVGAIWIGGLSVLLLLYPVWMLRKRLLVLAPAAVIVLTLITVVSHLNGLDEAKSYQEGLALPTC